MTDLMEIIKGRRGIRTCQDKDVTEVQLNQIPESVRWSPSWANAECWEVLVVKDLAIKENLQGLVHSCG
jgi:nitroreductase